MVDWVRHARDLVATADDPARRPLVAKALGAGTAASEQALEDPIAAAAGTFMLGTKGKATPRPAMADKK